MFEELLLEGEAIIDPNPDFAFLDPMTGADSAELFSHSSTMSSNHVLIAKKENMTEETMQDTAAVVTRHMIAAVQQGTAASEEEFIYHVEAMGEQGQAWYDHLLREGRRELADAVSGTIAELTGMSSHEEGIRDGEFVNEVPPVTAQQRDFAPRVPPEARDVEQTDRPGPADGRSPEEPAAQPDSPPTASHAMEMDRIDEQCALMFQYLSSVQAAPFPGRLPEAAAVTLQTAWPEPTEAQKQIAVACLAPLMLRCGITEIQASPGYYDPYRGDYIEVNLGTQQGLLAARRLILHD